MRQHSSYFLFVPRSDKVLILIEDAVYPKIGTLSLVLRADEQSIYLLVLCRLEVYGGRYFYLVPHFSKRLGYRDDIVKVCLFLIYEFMNG